MNWKEWFYYDSESPTGLRWTVQRHGGAPHNRILVVDVGDVAGCVTVQGYGEVKLDGKSYKTHRIIFEMFNGALPEGIDVDHWDGNRLNNVPSNLRPCTDAINSQNRPKRVDNTSGVTGVVKIYNGITYYWTAKWVEAGKEKSKSFRIDRFGDEEALKLATEYRQAMIKKLVESGQYYTERHGK